VGPPRTGAHPGWRSLLGGSHPAHVGRHSPETKVTDRCSRTSNIGIPQRRLHDAALRHDHSKRPLLASADPGPRESDSGLPRAGEGQIPRGIQPTASRTVRRWGGAGAVDCTTQQRSTPDQTSTARHRAEGDIQRTVPFLLREGAAQQPAGASLTRCVSTPAVRVAYIVGVLS